MVTSFVLASAGCFPPLKQKNEDVADTAGAEITEQDMVATTIDTAQPDDTAVSDTARPDDTGVSDSHAPPDTIADTHVPDTMVADAAPLDTHAVDTASGDTQVVATCPGGCAHLDAACRRGFCDAGTCTAELLSDVACDDGEVCTVGDRCESGACAGLPRLCDDGKACSIDDCSEAAGGCVADHSACGCAGNDALCDDGNDCNGKETCGADTLCHPGTPVVCSPAADPCKANTCQSGSGLCQEGPANEDAPCDDGAACTDHDRCRAGACDGDPVQCDDGLACTVEACSAAASGCAVTSDACECATDGDCANDTLCDGVETCNSERECVPGTPVGCAPSGDPCQVNGCVPSTGLCALHNAPGTPSCDDGDSCTVGDRCQVGSCQAGSPVSDAFGDWNRVIGADGGLLLSLPLLATVLHPDGRVGTPIIHAAPLPLYTTSLTTPATTIGTNGADYALHLVTYSPTASSVVTGLIATLEHSSVGNPLIGGNAVPLGAGQSAFVLGRSSSYTTLTLADGTTLPTDWATVISVDNSGGVAWRRMLEGTGFTYPKAYAVPGENGVLVSLSHWGAVTVRGASGQAPVVLQEPTQNFSTSLVRYDASGTRLWTRTLIPGAFCGLSMLIASTTGTMLATGCSSASEGGLTIQGDTEPLVLPKLGTSGIDAAFVALDSTGAPSWAKAVTSQRPNTFSDGVAWSATENLWIAIARVVGDAALYGTEGVEMVFPVPSDAGDGDTSLLLALDVDGTPVWGRSLGGNQRHTGLVALKHASQIVWLTTLAETRELDGVSMPVSTGESVVYAVIADAADGQVTAATQVASYQVGAGSLSETILRLTAGPDDELIFDARGNGTVALGSAIVNQFSVPVGSAYFVARINSGGALLCQ